MTIKEMIQRVSEYAQGMNVLYVEDEIMIRDNTKLLLETIFPSVDIASNGREGVEYYGAKAYDIVITDILMPEMNGVNMIRSMKEMNGSQHFGMTPKY